MSNRLQFMFATYCPESRHAGSANADSPAASPRLAGRAGVARADDGDPIVLGLSLTRRAALAARRAGYGQVFLLAGNGAATPGVAAIPDWSRAAATFTSSHAAPLIIAPAAILAETDWLERLALTRIEPAAWATIPDRIVMLAAASVPDALAALGEEGGARDLIAVQGRLARRFGPPAPISGRDRSHDRADVGGRPRCGTAPHANAGQGHGRIHGAPRRAADLVADFTPPGANRDNAQSNEPHFHRRRNMRRAVFPVRAPLPANDRGAPVPCPFDPGRVRRRTGPVEIPGIAMGRRSRFLGGQCRSRRHIRLHGAWLEPGRRSGLAALARRRGRSRRVGVRRLRLLAAVAPQGRRRRAVHLGLGGARAPRWRACSTPPRVAISSIS